MEAMTAGRALVTSDLGALAGDGRRLHRSDGALADPHAHAEAFAGRVIDLLAVLAAREADPASTEAHLQAQVAYAVAENNWARRAEQWSTWFSMLA